MSGVVAAAGFEGPVVSTFRQYLPALIAFAWALSIGQDQAGADEVDVKVVKYDALGKAIKEHKGKIVVVDFWADT
jgi:thiol:disulfide interchange protein